MGRSKTGTFLLITAVSLILTGCANTSRFETGTLTAFGGHIDPGGGVRYYLVNIDARGAPPEQLPALALPLPGAEHPVPVNELTPALTARYLPAFVPPPQWPDTWKAKARSHPAFEGNGFYVGFGENGLESAGLCSHCAGGRQAPGLCTADGHICHVLPITRAQLVELVGPPDRESKVMEVRY